MDVVSMYLKAEKTASRAGVTRPRSSNLSGIVLLLVLLLTMLPFLSGCSKIMSVFGGSAGPRVEVLLYHSLEPGGSETWPVVDPNVFCSQIDLLLEKGWQPLTLHQFAAWAKGEKELEENAFLLTFDDGAESIYHYAFPYLLHNEIPAVVFLIGKHHDPCHELTEKVWVPKLNDSQIEEMFQSGLVAFQSHSYDLHREIGDKPAALAVSPSRVLDDFLQSREVIEDLTGKDVYCIAYPFGAANCDIVKAAEKAGFQIGFALNGQEESGQSAEELLLINRVPLDNYSLEQFRDYFDI